MIEVFVDALLDSLKVLAILVVANILIGLLEGKISNTLERSKKWTPVVGSVFAILPQCGFSVVATDLYQKKHISMGTLLAVYISTSDEALPIMLADPDKILMTLPLIGIKILLGVAVGYLVDGIFHKKRCEVAIHAENCHDEHEEEEQKGCCGHHIGEGKGIKQYLVHPLLHSLKIFAYVLVINFIFGIIIYYVGEDTLTGFLQSNGAFAPFLSVLVGLIPNCASSVIITNLYLLGGISFGACVGGLCANAGLGLLFLLKDTKNIKGNLIIIGILVAASIAIGYLISGIEILIA